MRRLTSSRANGVVRYGPGSSAAEVRSISRAGATRTVPSANTSVRVPCLDTTSLRITHHFHMIHIVDYGMGNLRSVQKAFERLGIQALVCDRPDQLRDAPAMVLPGVGAFRDAINAINRHDLAGPDPGSHRCRSTVSGGSAWGYSYSSTSATKTGNTKASESCRGRSSASKSQPGLRIPHMGWNEVQFAQHHTLFDGVSGGSHFYFVHSYHVVPHDDSVIATRTDHGGEFVSAVARGNLVATQFHPEKSQNNGRQVFENFGRLAEAIPLA